MEEQNAPGFPPASKLDQFLRIEEAAQILRVSKSWLYQRRHELPFLVQLPNKGPLRVSVRRLKEWLDGST